MIALTPEVFGARGNGADDTAPLRTWLKAIEGREGKATQVYDITDQLVAPNNTHIFGIPGIATGIRQAANFPVGKCIFLNGNAVVDEAQITDAGCRFSHMNFWGQPVREGMNNLLAFIGVRSVKFTDCGFYGHRATMLGLNNIDSVILEDCYLNDWGSLSAVPFPGKCLYDGGYAIWAGANIRDIRVFNTTCENGQWHAINVNGIKDGLLDGFVSKNTKEGSIFGGCKRLKVVNFSISGVRRKDCAANGIEITCDNLILANGFINDTDHSSVYVSDSTAVNIHDLSLSRGTQEASADTPAASGDNGMITLLASDPNLPMSDVQIHHNLMTNADRKTSYGIACYAWGGKPMNSITAGNNQMGGDARWKGSAVLVGDGAKGDLFNVSGF